VLTSRYVPPSVLVDEEFRLHHVFGEAGTYLRIGSGAPQLNVLELVHPEVARVLTAAIPTAARTGESVLFQPIVLRDGDEPGAVRVTPFSDANLARKFVIATFESTVAPRNHDVVVLDDRIETYLTDMQTELAAAGLNRRELVEQLETFNEELQAANEELLASNEELQATNEELQSVNEELHTVNVEFQQKVVQHETLSADLDHLLTATDIGTLFLDDEMTIRKFTPSIADFLPLLDRDLGRRITDLAVRIDDTELISNIEYVRESGRALETTVESRSGPVLVRILPYQSHGSLGVIVTFTNVTEVKRTYDLARRVLDAFPAQVAFVAADGTIRMVNHQWERFGDHNGLDECYSAIGANYFDVCAGSDDGERVVLGIKSVLNGERDIFTLEYPCDSPTEKRWFLLWVTATPDRAEAVVVHFDVTERKKTEAMLGELATHDYLTSVLNRRGFDHQLTIEHNRVKRTGVHGAALLIDCDNFKRINDELGLVGGDAVLSTVARRIENALRPGDTLARVGGDEFVVLLPELRIAEAEVVAERIRLAISSSAVAISHGDIHLTVSVAVCGVDEHTHSLESLLERTRYSLASSKSLGKNRVTYSGSDGVTVTPLVAHRHALTELVADESALACVRQPLVTIADGVTVGYEFLTRVPASPSVGPLTLFQRAQEDGQLNQFDERCLRLALDSATRVGPTLWRTINLYPSTLLRMPEQTLAELFESVEQDCYFIELSEQQILGDASYLLPPIERLRSFGVGIAVDDVGFGRTALESLLILEPEIVKIDRTYINGVAASSDRQRWLSRLVRAASSLEADLVAEGIEDESDAKVALDLGIEYGQGYLFGRPSTA
jgi:diguanylate cyclase (GGDEF)-like protein